MKNITIGIQPYFCPKCGQFRTAPQTERSYTICDSYGYRPDPKLATKIEGVVRTCLLCGTKVHDTDNLVFDLLRRNIIQNYSAQHIDHT